MRNAKGQFWSFDVIFAVIIFSFAITILAFTWYSINSQLSLGYSNGSNIMQQQLRSLSQSLLSPGVPAYWQGTVDTTNSLTWGGVYAGLAQNQSGAALSPAKVYALLSMSNEDYQATKQLLGVGYDYYITIKSIPRTGSGINISIGSSPFNKGALTIYVANRNAVINGMPVNMRVLLWTNRTLATS
jgi:hypothetical protein